MKVHKAVTYSSLAIILLTAILMASLPFRFPSSDIAWRPMLIFFMPALVLAGLLFIRPLLALRVFRNILAMAAVLSIVATFAGWMAFVILCIFLAALGALYLQGNRRKRRWE